MKTATHMSSRLFSLSLGTLGTLVLALVPRADAQDAWQALSGVGAPIARIFYHANTAIWTGNEMLIWGGSTGADQATILGDGARYNPATDTWMAMTATGAPSARADFTAVWTGSEMIIWGGYNAGNLNTGARYNPVLNSWAPISTVNAPSARLLHTAVWTGSEMIVWGGFDYDGSYHMKGDGARYSPTSDTWTTLTTAGAPSARTQHAAVWTGAEMIIWG